MDKDFILKANLFEHGIKISAEAKKDLDSKSDIWVLNDFVATSGISLNFNNEYVTTRVNQDSKYVLLEDNGKLFISDGKNCTETIVIFPPNYMKDEIIIDNKRITDYVTMSTDRVRIQLMTGCANNCKFCNGNEFPYGLNTAESIDKALQIALAQDKDNIRHGHISISNVKTEEELVKLTSMFEFFGKKYPGFFDLMSTPRGFTSYTDSTQYKDYLKFIRDAGICGVAANMELNNVDILKYYCPEKAIIGQENYLKYIEAAVEIFPKGHVRSLLIVGIEPLEETLKGVEKLAMRGCIPVLSPLYPYGEANVQPSAELLIEAKKKSQEICDKYGIKLGPTCRPCSHNTL